MRIAMGIEYNGCRFYGWQTQENLPTIQSHLETALSSIANHSINVFCAGRTDAAVHAIGQVIHFDTTAIRSLRGWTLGTNSHLPPTIAVLWAQEVDNEFHARHSALARCYYYLIYNHSVRLALLTEHASWHHPPLNAERMHQAGQYLLGENDFSSFRSSQCNSKSPMRNVHKLQVSRQGDYVIVEIQANAFLHHMVRNIVGTLMAVGEGTFPAEWIAEVLAAKDRRKALETAPAAGLYLSRVDYPAAYAFPVKKLFINNN